MILILLAHDQPMYRVAGIFFYSASSDFPALSGIISKNVINISFALIYWLSGNEI